MMRSKSVRTKLGLYSCACVFAVCVAGVASASPLSFLGAPETEWWSDMAFPTGVTGDFDSGTLDLTITASPSNDLELGAEFFNNGRHYGTGGTIGGPFSATLSVSGVDILPDGTVTDGGTVSVVYNAGAPGSIGDDYGVSGGASLLEGTVIAVLMDATGADTLDILYEITGGALQSLTNPDLPGVPFSPNNLGLIRIAGAGPLPADFSSNFSIDGATINNFGVPEPTAMALALLGGFAVMTRRRRAL